MTKRALWLDAGPGETRGVVTLNGRPELLLIERDGEVPGQRLGTRLAARVRQVERGRALAFVDLGEGRDGVVNLKPEMGRLGDGDWLEVEVMSEARDGKGAQLRLLGPTQGPARLIAAGAGLEDRLQEVARDAAIIRGGQARAVADVAEGQVLAREFALPGGGSLAIEPTRALTAVDVDLGDRREPDGKRAARAVNLIALTESARLLRLKGLGGLIVIDLVGRTHDAPVLLSAARAAFGPDQPGVVLGPISRFGTLELAIPRRARPALEALGGTAGASVQTLALRLVRALEREAQRDGGGRFEAVASSAVCEAAVPALAKLVSSVGARVSVRAEAGRADPAFEVQPL